RINRCFCRKSHPATSTQGIVSSLQLPPVYLLMNTAREWMQLPPANSALAASSIRLAPSSLLRLVSPRPSAVSIGSHKKNRLFRDLERFDDRGSLVQLDVSHHHARRLVAFQDLAHHRSSFLNTHMQSSTPSPHNSTISRPASPTLARARLHGASHFSACMPAPSSGAQSTAVLSNPLSSHADEVEWSRSYPSINRLGTNSTASALLLAGLPSDSSLLLGRRAVWRRKEVYVGTQTAPIHEFRWGSSAMLDLRTSILLRTYRHQHPLLLLAPRPRPRMSF
ncbi:hypothetical protein R3P38DRAFT_3508163, partial [Favolaschia claudopus]